MLYGQKQPQWNPPDEQFLNALVITLFIITVIVLLIFGIFCSFCCRMSQHERLSMIRRSVRWTHTVKFARVDTLNRHNSGGGGNKQNDNNNSIVNNSEAGIEDLEANNSSSIMMPGPSGSSSGNKRC